MKEKTSLVSVTIALLLAVPTSLLEGSETKDSGSANVPAPADPANSEREALKARVERAEEELRALRALVGETAPPAGALAPAQARGAEGPAPAAAPIDQTDTVEEALGAAAPEPGARMPALPIRFPLEAHFGNGFELRSHNEEFSFQLHNLTQFDGRFYSNTDQQTVKDTFVFPRQWFIFNGRLTKPYEYYVSIAEGFDALNILDVFLNIHYDDRLQLKVGRYKTPFTYEFYNGPIFGLIHPERSLFFNNFGLNRDLGVMAWGMLFEKRLDYAVGIFNGQRNGFIDPNNNKDLAAYANFRPFLLQEGSKLQNLAFGYSIDHGHQDNAPVPRTFRTTVATTGNDIIGVPFLTLNPDVLEMGLRDLHCVHLAYYQGPLSLIGEWGFGSQNYARTTDRGRQFVIPIQSYYIQAGYFLTGETVTGRGVCQPRRPFDLRKGRIGPGAWELFFRYNYLNIGRQVFNSGLSDPNLYTNELYSIIPGFNWYWNQYLKFVFEWENDQFAQPTLYRLPDLKQKTNNLFLFRFQIFF